MTAGPRTPVLCPLPHLFAGEGAEPFDDLFPARSLQCGTEYNLVVHEIVSRIVAGPIARRVVELVGICSRAGEFKKFLETHSGCAYPGIARRREPPCVRGAARTWINCLRRAIAGRRAAVDSGAVVGLTISNAIAIQARVWLRASVVCSAACRTLIRIVTKAACARGRALLLSVADDIAIEALLLSTRALAAARGAARRSCAPDVRVPDHVACAGSGWRQAHGGLGGWGKLNRVARVIDKWKCGAWATLVARCAAAVLYHRRTNTGAGWQRRIERLHERRIQQASRAGLTIFWGKADR